MSFAKQFSTQPSCWAAGAASASAGASCVPHSSEPHHRHRPSSWASPLKPCSAVPQLDGRIAYMEDRRYWLPSRSWTCGFLQPWSLRLLPKLPMDQFVDTVGLTGLVCGFFGDLDLFESCLQSFPRIPFHLAEARCSFSPLLV